ncbi:Uncharacterised protein [Streptococcus pneumoniae]|nr:Uncharacterised protein [Streptococcus pneumoniae]
MILFENLFKPGQLHLAVGMVTDFRQFYPQPQNTVLVSIHNLKTVF